jgi:hypothetical protein
MALSFLNAVLQSGSPDLAARTVAALRATLMADVGPIQQDKWAALRRLEFKVHPASEHLEVRRRIAEDLARFTKSDEQKTAKWLAFLSGGYQSVGGPPSFAAAE